MEYEYKMVQIPPTITVQGAPRGTEAAKFLEAGVNREARDGWEFYRVDSLGEHTPAGCLGSLGGKQGETSLYYVITFRRPIATTEGFEEIN